MKIFVENLEFVGRHGVYEEERRDGRRFRVDLSVEIDDETARPATEEDALEGTLDYRTLADIVLEVGRGPSCSLIEHLGSKMLETVFERCTRVESAELTLRKFATGVPGDPEAVGITLEKSR